jgi:hypothetical protein
MLKSYHVSTIVELARLVRNWTFPFSFEKNTSPPPGHQGLRQAGYDTDLVKEESHIKAVLQLWKPMRDQHSNINL